MRQRLLTSLLVLACFSSSRAAVGDPQIRTDHPLYPGELAYSTMDRFAHSIINSGDWGLGLGNSERDVALKLWLWKITHTLHDYTPKTWTPLDDYDLAKFGTHSQEHPVRPDPAAPPSILDEDQDSLRWTFSYGYALCTTLHGNIGPQIEAIGHALGKEWRSRCVNIPGDTNHEIYFAGKWRVFDVNSAALLWSSNDPDTAELLPFAAAFGPKGGSKRADLLDNAPRFNGQFLPKLVWGDLDHHDLPKPYDWLHGLLDLPMFYWDDDRTEHKHPYLSLMYYNGYSAFPIIYTLKKGETFTRWFSGDDARKELALPSPIWWGSNIKGGPGSVCHYAHYLRDLPGCCRDTEPLIFSADSQLDDRYALRDFKEATHGNGLYDWQPNMAAGDWKEGAVEVEGPVSSDGSALLAADTATLTFAFFSPYVIAGMPANETDPAVEGATHGAILDVGTVGTLPVEISVNRGLTFKPIGTVSGTSQLDFTDAVKGRNQYRLRIHLNKGNRLETLRLRTIVTTCRAVYPKLKSGKTTITYLADGLSAFAASPDFTSGRLATAPASFVSQENLVWAGYDTPEKVAWKTDRDMASCIYKVVSPAGNLVQVSAAANITWPAPTRSGSWGELAVSASPDGPWTVVRTIDPRGEDIIDKNVWPYYWIHGATDVSNKNIKTAYVRIRFAGAGEPCGIRFLRLFGTYRTANTSPLTITYYWQSAGQTKVHTETVPAGQSEHVHTIETGNDVRNIKVVLAVPAS